MNLRKPLPLVTVVLWVTSLLAGCGPATILTPPPVTPTLEPDWTVYERPADGFAIALPLTWEQIDLEAAALAMNLDAWKERNPHLADVLDQARQLAASNGKFLAVDIGTSTTSGYTSNVTIVKSPLKYALSADELALDYLDKVESLTNVVSSPEYKRVDLPAGRSAQIQYMMALTLPDARAKTVTVSTYLITKDRDAFVITFGAAADQASDYVLVFEKIAQSFRWVK